MASMSISLVVLLAVLCPTLARDFYVVAPNTFRLGSEEKVAVAVEGNNDVLMRIVIQDHPGKIKNISEVTLAVRPGQPELVTIRLDPANFPPNFLSAPGSQKLVTLTAHIDNLKKELIIPLSSQSGYVFIQTDKPIYTPNQRVQMRIISLTEEMSPSSNVFQLQIKNPKDIIVQEKIFNEKAQHLKAFVTHIYKFPNYPVLGEWSAIVRYGHNLEQNSTIRFELQEYVLPTFTVQLTTQDVILPSDDSITIGVVAKHVYGKNVQGLVTFRFGVKGNTPNVIYFAVLQPKELVDGAHEVRIKTESLKDHKDVGWFPEIEGSHFVVEATVIDAATGNHESTTDVTAQFSKSPFQISFQRCLKDFKPGLVSVFEADVKFVDGRPAKGIMTKIKALADGKPLNIVKNSAVSNDDGKIAFEIQPEIHHSTVSITIETSDPRYIRNQAVGTFVQTKFQSSNNAYVALARSSERKLRPGDMFSKLIHFEPAGMKNIYYVIVARGKIYAMHKLPEGAFKTQQVDFEITHDLVPDFRILVFAHFGNELLADSLKIEVERVCNPNAQVTITPEYGIKEPGSNGKISINGPSGTLVGLLGVDEAVYALSKKDLLTKAKVFNKFATHDLGCGPGGGLTVNSVLGNAGITIGTNKYSPKLEHSCVEIKRRKREAARNIVNTYTGIEKQCCSLGIQRDKYNRNCQERTNIVVRQLQGDFHNCSKAFLDCCLHAEEHGITDMKLMTTGMGRIGGHNLDNPEFISAEEENFFEKTVTVRKDFRDTWIYEEIPLGPDGIGIHEASLPHSITTWVIQAVSVSDNKGICVTEPQKLVSFKKIFLHLNLPYSVIRNEQVEIRATVFNYGDKKIAALVYMYGTENLCSGTQPGEKSERKRFYVNPHSAETVVFPVIPLTAEDFTIKMVVLSSEGHDVIEKKLHVVPEGELKELNIPIKLDPSNRQRRRERHVNNGFYTDTIDPSQNIQVTAVRLAVPEGFVPGTESCSISAIGNQFGPAVETTINNPDALLQKPRGCGEQNMMFLAPTLYTMRYLKMAGKLTAASEAKGYEFIRHGYGNQLAFRKNDGSYAAYQKKPTSAWLTAFVMKVFCQANELVHIDEKVLCSGVRWLIKNQEADGSYIEKHPMYHIDMMGGVQGKVPMTAFTLIALEECNCDEENLILVKKRAMSYIEDHLGEVNDQLPVAIVAYALALSDSDLKQAVNDRLLSMAKTNDGLNTMYWETKNSARNVETAGYALLTQLLYNDLDKSASIVNWLNTQQLQSGSFKSTQDTVIALQSLSEYAIRAQQPSINLVANISSSNDRQFHKVLSFHEDNALVLQDVKVDKIGGTLFINTAGQGVGYLGVKLRYNMLVPPEETSRFDLTINVTEAKQDKKNNAFPRIDPRGKDMFAKLPADRIRGVVKALNKEPPGFEFDPRNRPPPQVLRASLMDEPMQKKLDRIRVKRQISVENSKPKYKISICVRYLGNKDAEMSIVDVGIFSGFNPVVEDLKELEADPNHLIQRYETMSSGVIFYLQKVPTKENYCFAFHIIREYIVNNTQMRAIKVYDYYNPDEITTKFYGPGNNSPFLRTICVGRVCECAEGGCPPNTPFAEVKDLDIRNKRSKIYSIACRNFDYVWKGKLDGEIRKDGGFLNISFIIEEVVKEGIEKKIFIQGASRTLLARDNCPLLFPGQTYLIMGKDGQKYENNNGETWYRYLLDKNSEVYLWTPIRSAADRDLQRALNHVINKLKKDGCPE